MKGYRLYDVQSKQIFISRDVIFHEEIFPFHTVVASDKLVDPFPDLVLPKALDVPLISQPTAPIHTDLQDISDISQHEESFIPGLSVHDTSPDAVPSPDAIPLPLRQSSRITKPPSYLRDFHCNLLSHKQFPTCAKSYPLSNFSYEFLSSSHKNFVMNVSSQYEPQFYHQAITFSQ